MTYSPEEVTSRIKASRELAYLDLASRNFQRSTTSFFYFSFADPNLPKGTQFLGACCIPADSIDEAMVFSHALKINPGGEVVMYGPLPLEALNEGYADRLMTSKEEIDKALIELN